MRRYKRLENQKYKNSRKLIFEIVEKKLSYTVNILNLINTGFSSIVFFSVLENLT